MKTIKELEKKIRSLVPELMELSFGCEFIAKKAYGDSSSLFFITKYWDTGNTETIEYLIPEYSSVGTLNTGEDDFSLIEVIGRPITLEHVLIALSKIAMSKHILVLPSGNMYEFESGYLEKPQTKWKLGQPWEEQEKVHKFLSKHLL